jgi:hypothetical protein
LFTNTIEFSILICQQTFNQTLITDCLACLLPFAGPRQTKAGQAGILIKNILAEKIANLVVPLRNLEAVEKRFC